MPVALTYERIRLLPLFSSLTLFSSPADVATLTKIDAAPNAATNSPKKSVGRTKTRTDERLGGILTVRGKGLEGRFRIFGVSGNILRVVKVDDAGRTTERKRETVSAKTPPSRRTRRK